MRVWCFLGGVLVVATRAKYADATMHALMPAHITHHTSHTDGVGRIDRVGGQACHGRLDGPGPEAAAPQEQRCSRPWAAG